MNNFLQVNRENLGKYREVIRAAIKIVAIIVCVCGVYYIYINRHVKFQDPNMAYEISRTIGEDVEPEDVRYKDVYAIKELDIGYPGKYDTLKDIELCKNLQRLAVNGGGDKWKPLKSKEDIQFLTNKQTHQYQNELSEIVPKLRKLKDFSFTNIYGNCSISNFDFLAECHKIEVLWICYSEVDNFKFLYENTKIKEINLWGSNIKSADDLKPMSKLESICIFDTPLSEDETEVESLCEAFPDAKIFISADRLQNDDRR